jgi:PIN domain nuclease of toxin-antitoxin system
MRVLVDTHAILWWLAGDRRLPRTARHILESSVHSRLISFVSLWEIAMKMSSRKLIVRDLSFPDVVRLLQSHEFEFLPIRLGDLESLDSLPRHHRDPFHRLLIAQSIEEGIPLMTSDSWAEDYPLRVVW